jgi:dihydropteroate synthase
MTAARARDARPSPSAIIDSLFPHNAHVIGGYDPLPLRLPAASPHFHELASAHGTYATRLQGVDESVADELLRALGRVGGAAHSQPVEDGVDIVVFASLPQVDALRAQLLAASGRLQRLAEEIVTVLHAYHRTEFSFDCGGRQLECGLKPLVMGVINCTPDSFYEGSRLGEREAAELGESMVEAGAGLLDVGGESTRPGSAIISVQEEIDRVLPVIEVLAARVDVPISIDTSKAAVAEAALAAGASMVNDVRGLEADPELGSVIAAAEVPIILMHSRGPSERMHEKTRYEDLIADILKEIREALGRATRAGIDPEATLVDPGIGFAKTAEQSLMLLRHLNALRSLGRPIVVGPSRKSFIGAVLGLPAEERLEGTAAAVACAVLAGAHVVRVHDVRSMRRAADVAAAIRSEGVGWTS